MKTELSPVLINSYESDGYINRPLTKKEIANKLADHSVSHYTTDTGKLIAAETFANGDVDNTDTTAWTLFDLLSFLNY